MWVIEYNACNVKRIFSYVSGKYIFNKLSGRSFKQSLKLRMFERCKIPLLCQPLNFRFVAVCSILVSVSGTNFNLFRFREWGVKMKWFAIKVHLQGKQAQVLFDSGN